ncbi:MAG: hypothetical protein IJX92_02290 [Clostridia bacterium]|nr:hypothetical protein [Clostridia bacterium]
MKNYNKIREDMRAPKWAAMAEYVGGEDGKKLVDAMQDFYSIYTDDVIDWYAGLYDVNIGGWYYSASARDNERSVYMDKEIILLPDAESTCQALGFWSGSGMAARGNDEYKNVIPAWMRDDIVKFITSLQDEDGYFYHKQWGKSIPPARRGRDYMWCMSMLKTMGAEPKYASLADCEDNADKSEILIPDYLKDKSSFLSYAENLFATRSTWSAGNELAAQVTLIKASGLIDTAVDFLNSKQLAENGCWEEGVGYAAVNGLLKISCVYNNAGRALPYAMEGARAAIGCIVAEEDIKCVCDLYNTWYTITNITNNLRKYGGSDGERKAEEILRDIRHIAPYAIQRTKEKIAPHKKESGSFSYYKNSPCPTSQSMPVAVPYLWEGDGNATNIAIVGTTNFVTSALGLGAYKVPLFSTDDGERYLSLLEEKKNNAK